MRDVHAQLKFKITFGPDSIQFIELLSYKKLLIFKYFLIAVSGFLERLNLPTLCCLKLLSRTSSEIKQ